MQAGSIAGARLGPIWVTTDGIPTNDNNQRYRHPKSQLIETWFRFSEDGAKRIIEEPKNFNLLPSTGTNLQTTELAPGASVPMVNIIVSFESLFLTASSIELLLSTITFCVRQPVYRLRKVWFSSPQWLEKLSTSQKMGKRNISKTPVTLWSRKVQCMVGEILRTSIGPDGLLFWWLQILHMWTELHLTQPFNSGQQIPKVLIICIQRAINTENHYFAGYFPKSLEVYK